MGYVVRWGATKDRMDHSARVYTTNVDYGFFDKRGTYYVYVQPFNEAGLGKKSRMLTVSPSGTMDIQTVETDDNATGDYISLSGIRTKKPEKGVYIKGHKKYIK